MPAHRPRPERALPRTATAPIIGLLVAMLAVVALLLVVRSGPEAGNDLAINISASGGSSTDAVTPPPLTEPILDPALSLDAAPSSTLTDPSNSATAADTPTAVPTVAAVAAATELVVPTLAPTVAATATPAPAVSASTANEQAATPEPVQTVAPTATATLAPAPSATPTLVPAPTATLIPAPTATLVPAPTATPTLIPEPTATLVAAPTATSTVAPPTSTAVAVQAAQSLGQLESLMLNQVNQVRANAGLSPLAPSSALASIGRDWSQQMANAGGISHRPSNQLSAMMPAGWRGWAENVAQAPYGSRVGSVEEAVRWAQNALEQSPGHYANMVGNYNTLGIGLHVQGDYVWVTQNFGNY